MRNIYGPFGALIALGLMISCSEDAEEKRASVTITAEDIPYVAGKQLSYTNFDLYELAEIDLPYGEDQYWDFSDMSTAGSFKSTPFEAFSDASLPGANFSFSGTMYNSLSGASVPALFIREHGADGIYRRSNRMLQEDVVSIFDGAGSLVFKSGDQVFTNGGDPMYMFPSTYGSNQSSVSTVLADFEVTLPSAGLDQTPANTLDSVFTDLTVSSWGRVKLPGSKKEYEVIVQLADRMTHRYFLLGGELAPADLLAGLGLQQNMSSSEIIITFIAPEHGIIAAAGIYDGYLSFGYFRNDLPD